MADTLLIAQAKLVRLPQTPNFFIGVDSEASIPIAEVDDRILRQIGKLWTDALIAKARKRRAATSGDPTPAGPQT